MDSLTLHLEMMTSGNYLAAAHAHALAVDSRRWLEGYRARNRLPDTTVLMSCLLCDAERLEMHHLTFRMTALEEFSAEHLDVDLKTALSRFGVCKDCFARYRGSHRRIVFDLNRVLKTREPSPRILH